jgi:hypothetical protein
MHMHRRISGYVLVEATPLRGQKTGELWVFFTDALSKAHPAIPIEM